MAENLKKQADEAKKARLLASKKAWNRTTKLLIAKLIAFKKSLNGVGDSDAKLQELDIKDPFPVEFHTYLASIVDDFSNIAEGADFVMNLQDDFSVNRRKGKKDLRQVAADIDTYDQLVAEGSWWGSRAWAWFALRGLGKDVGKARWKMLSFIRKSIDKLNTIEYHFTSKEPASDVLAIVELTRFINSYVSVYLGHLKRLKEIEEPPQLEGAPIAPTENPVTEKPGTEPGTEEPGDDIVSGPPPGDNLRRIKVQVEGNILEARVDRVMGSSYDNNQKIVIKKLFDRLIAALGVEKPDEELVSDIYMNLDSLLKTAESHTDVKNAQTEEVEYRKIAQNILQRWWSRQMLESDSLKLIIADDIRDVVESLKELMDVIESLDHSTEDIEEKTKYVSVILSRIAKDTLSFADDYRMAWRLEEDPKKRPPVLEERPTSKLKNLIGLL